MLASTRDTCEDAKVLKTEFVAECKSKEFTKWKRQALEMRDLMKISPQAQGWIGTHGMKSVPDTERCKETFALAYFAAKAKALELDVSLNKVLEGWTAEPGCSIYRKPWGTVRVP